MKVGFIAEPNSKGQIVIPKKIRDDLKIDENTPLNLNIVGDGIWIHPVRGILTDKELKDSHSLYLEVLNKTRGILAGKPYYKNEKARKKLALKASARRKKVWW